ncbi:MAG TPA: class F sortase [Dehalococcoidia bacterium]|nr:class F sortase [Dehalococcoidia bacterium]
MSSRRPRPGSRLFKDFSPKFAMLGALLVPVVAIAVAAVVLLSGGNGGSADNSAIVKPVDTATPVASVTAQALAVDATAAPTGTPPIPGSEQNDRIIITKANVDAPIKYKDVPPQGGALPSPDTPDDVVFYDFAGFDGFGGSPGVGGNAIFSGHVDSGHMACKNGTVQPPCEAVFWDINKLSQGDIIEIDLGDFVYKYSVTGAQDIKADDVAKWADVWKATPTESITLITCAGDFNRTTSEYDSRHVVTAARLVSPQ